MSLHNNYRVHSSRHACQSVTVELMAVTFEYRNTHTKNAVKLWVNRCYSAAIIFKYVSGVWSITKMSVYSKL